MQKKTEQGVRVIFSQPSHSHSHIHSNEINAENEARVIFTKFSGFLVDGFVIFSGGQSLFRVFFRGRSNTGGGSRISGVAGHTAINQRATHPSEFTL